MLMLSCLVMPIQWGNVRVGPIMVGEDVVVGRVPIGLVGSIVERIF